MVCPSPTYYYGFVKLTVFNFLINAPLGKNFPKLMSLRTAFDDVVNRPSGTTIPHPRKFLVCSVEVKSGYYDRFNPVENENVILGNIYANQVSYYITM